MTGYTSVMKTAISVPDDVFKDVEACARRMKVSRSSVFTAAAREFVRRQRPAEDATEAWNRAIRACGQPGDDPAAAAFRRRTKAVVRRSRTGDW